jgi:hypothetical protein
MTSGPDRLLSSRNITETITAILTSSVYYYNVRQAGSLVNLRLVPGKLKKVVAGATQ